MKIMIGKPKIGNLTNKNNGTELSISGVKKDRGFCGQVTSHENHLFPNSPYCMIYLWLIILGFISLSNYITLSETRDLVVAGFDHR